MKNKFVPFAENFAESTTACLVTMVQGNLLALGLSHWVIASQTGILAGTATGVAIVAAQVEKRWVVALMLGVSTGVVDYFVHDGMIGPIFLEAVITGFGAAVLSYGVGTLIARYRARQAATATDSG